MNSRDTQKQPAPQRKPYRRPRLEKYGNIRDLTQIAGGSMGANDQVQMANKTGL